MVTILPIAPVIVPNRTHPNGLNAVSLDDWLELATDSTSPGWLDSD